MTVTDAAKTPTAAEAAPRVSGLFLRRMAISSRAISTLMRYKRLAERIRLAAGVDERVDLLWGLEQSIPAECRELDEDLCVNESDGCYSKLRRLYCVLDRMNFTEIEGTLALERQRDRFS